MATPKQAKTLPGKSSKEKTCPISREEFAEKAKAIDLAAFFQGRIAGVHDFTTGSFGWALNDKMDVVVNGKVCRLQIGLNMTVIGSKDLPRESE